MKLKKTKNNNFFLFMISLQFLLNLITIKSSELSEVGQHLLFSVRKEKNNDIHDLSEDEYMRQMMYKQLYSKFNLGIPSQRIKFYYETNYYESYITEDEYDKIRSTTYKLIDSRFKNITFDNNDFIINDTKGYLSQEIFEIDEEQKMNNFTFLLKGKSISGKVLNLNILGLNINSKKNEKTSFLDQLKQHKYIDKKIFTFLFGDYTFIESRSFDGQLLIGCLPHEINNNFDEKDLKWISIKDNSNSNKKWNINFDTVKYNNDEIKDKVVNLDLSLSIIVGPESFRLKLLEKFFKKHIENNICKENYFFNLKDEQFYIFYSCNNDAEFLEIPQISFYNKNFNETFIFSFSSLFTSYKHRFYFNIIFTKKPQNIWVFGQLFFNSYRFVFDLEQEKIGYYKTYPQKDRPFIAFIAFIVASIIFGIGSLFGYFNKIDNGNINDKNKYVYPIKKEYAQTLQKSNDNNNLKKEENNKINTKEKIN